jgi:hypothetical protein
MANFVYLLCFLTSVACAWLLIRSYLRTRTKLLLWSSLCFAGLAVNNALLFIDLAILSTDVDLSVYRAITALVSLLILIVGLIWNVL